MKRFIPFFLIIIVSLFYFNYLCVDTLEKEAVLLTQKEDEIKPAKTPFSLSLKGTYTALVDAKTGRLLYGRKEDIAAPMASTTKIMTCILALESGRTGETVTASKKAVTMPKVHLGMQTGENYLLSDLLYSLMLTSHNDTAVAIAEHLGGSVNGFANLMNQKAKALHMNQTHFVTPNGLDADGHQSTAYDMCLLGSYAIKNKDFLSIIRTPSHSFKSTSSGRSFSVSNKDAFLSLYEGALGIKTGYTNKAGYCFVGAAKQGDVSLVSTTLASGWPPNKSYKWQDTKALMDYGFKHYKMKELPLRSLSSLRIPVKEGMINFQSNVYTDSFVTCLPMESPRCLLSDFDNIRLVYQIPDELHAPVRKDVPLGHILCYINEKKMFTLPVYPSENIEKMYYSDLLSGLLSKFFL